MNKEEENEMELIQTKIKTFYSAIENYDEGNANTRYKSWEWCYKAFNEARKNYDPNDKATVDTLALQLGFYLASWGMYRGSSFLLQRDYKAHINVVKIILKEEYKDLWGFDPSKGDIIKTADLIYGDGKKEGIYNEIKSSYRIKNNNIHSSDEVNEDEDIPTDTLVTKILMGTFGCVPAFDRYLKLGIREYKRNNFCLGKYKLIQNISKRDTFLALCDIAKHYKKALSETIKIDNELSYPIMKFLDMFLWQWGKDTDEEKNK